jgi:hypothetical protein
MNKPIIKYIELGWGCGLRTGSDRQIYMEEGTNNIRLIRNATLEDIEHVRGSGGDIPHGRIFKSKK